MIDFTGRRVLVAGGSSGIGLGTARRFRTAGADVHVTGTRADVADYPDGDLDGLSYQQLDVADAGAVTRLAAQFDALDVLVPSVGTVAYGGAEYDIDTFRQVIDVNLNGVMALCTAFRTPLTGSTAASIVMIGSTSSFIATPGQPAYSASKGALVTLTKSLAAAWMGDAVLFLASSMASYITGQMLLVDGGITLM